MTVLFDTLQPCSFAGIEVPISDLSMKGGIRHHTHEFPHSPGGEPEKMGRKLYVVRMTIPAHDLPDSDMDRKYSQLRDRLKQLRDLWELQTTDKLVIPTVGTINAFAIDWDEQMAPQHSVSGTSFTVEYLEDQDNASLAETLPTFGIAKMLAANDDLQAKAAIANFKRATTQSVFQDINDAITEVLAVQGLADAYSRVVAGKIEAVVQLVAQADRLLQELQNPLNHLVLDALKDLWAAAVEAGENLVGAGTRLATWIVPTLMPINRISMVLFGSGDRSMELLQMNPIEDAFAVPAGFQIKYLKDD